MKNKKLRKLINNIHLWLGLVTGVVVFIISITGCLYVFEEEIRNFNDAAYSKISPQPKSTVGLAQIVNAYKAETDDKIGSIKIYPNEPGATFQVLNSDKKAYYFNPYTAKLINVEQADWLNTVLELHKTLLLGKTGEFIQAWSVVIFLVMLITGLILWFPHQRRLLKQSLSIKWKASVKRISFDLHQVLGFYAAVFLIVIALSGMYFAFSGAKQMVELVTGTKLGKGIKNTTAEPHVFKTEAERYQGMYKQVLGEIKGSQSAVFSVRKSGEIRLRITYPYRWSRKQNTFFFDEATGKLLRSKLYKNNNRADWYEATNYELHTGKLFGYAGKILWCLASLISASLPITGFIIWWKKGKKRNTTKVFAKQV